MAFGGFRKYNKPKRKRTAAHNMVDEFDLKKHKDELEKLLKRLHEDGTPIKPLTESAIMGLCRGAIREKWRFCDVKLAYLNMKTVPDEDANSRRRWKVQCEDCNNFFGKTEVAVDHKKGGHQLKSPDNLFQFYNNIINVGFAGIQVLCHECHDRKTVMDLYGYTREEAFIFKEVTAWEKKNNTVGKQKELLLSYGYSDEEISNKEKRRAAIWKYLEGKSKPR